MKENMYNKKQIADFLKKQFPSSTTKIVLEDDLYEILPKKFFKLSLMQRILGVKAWEYALGGADCGKRAVRLCAYYFSKFHDKGGVKFFQEGLMPAPIVGIVKYKRERQQDWHIILATVLVEDGKMKLMFIERKKDHLWYPTLSDTEMRSIKYFHSY
jgi:hypothetical protein